MLVYPKDKDSSISASTSLTWKIPSLSNFKKSLLCQGHSNNNCNKYIPQALIRLISHYFSNDRFTLQDLRDAEPGKSFCTQIVSIYSLKLYLKIFPDGISSSLKKPAVVLKTPPLSPEISKLTIEYKLIIKENNEIKEKRITADNTGVYGVSFLNNIELTEWDSFTVQLIIKRLTVYDKHQNIIHDYINKYNGIPYPVPLHAVNYEWSITDITTVNAVKNAIKNQWFSSPIFRFGKFKMALTFSPNNHGTENSVFFLRITSFPDSIKKIRLKCHFCIKETNTSYIDDNLSLYPGGELIGWPNGLLLRKELQDLLALTFMINFTIYEVLDEQEKIIPNYMETLSTENIRSVEVPIAKYVWNLCDKHTVQQIHSAKNVMSIISNILIIGPFRGYLAIYPNGINKKTENKLCFGLKLLYIPPFLSKVSWRFSMKFKEMSIKKTYIHCIEGTVDKKGSNPWCWLGIDIDRNKLKTMSTFTLITEASIIDLWGMNGEMIEDQREVISDDEYKFKELNEFPMTEYQWKIEGDTLKEIKNASNVFGVFSPVFIVFGLKWVISIYPKGSSIERDNNIGIGVSCLTLKSKKMMINAKVTISLLETGDKSATIYSGRCISNGWGCPVSKSSTNDLMNLDVITVMVNIELIDVWNYNDNITNELVNVDGCNECKNIAVPSEKYQWNIDMNILNDMKRSKNGKGFKSDIFKMYGMEFEIELFPNGKEEKQKGLTNICVTLISDLPSKNAIICTGCSLSVIEANKKVIISGIFYDEHECVEWKHSAGYQRLSFMEFMELNSCTIELEMDLIDVYDNNNDIMDEYVDFEKLKLKSWLENQVGLNEYYQLFIENGIDRLSMLQLITIDELNEIGVVNIAHKTRLLLDIAMLNID